LLKSQSDKRLVLTLEYESHGKCLLALSRAKSEVLIVVLLIVMMFRRALSDGEKVEYIEAVKCLQKSKPQGTKWFPNKSRYDDFVSVHINATGAALFDANGSMLLSGV
jgi:hypothetical protein